MESHQEMDRPSGRRGMGFAAGLLALLAAGALWPLKQGEDAFLVAAFCDALHFPAAMFAGWAVRKVLCGKKQYDILALGICLLLIVAAEGAQMLTGRSASWHDMVAGGLGAIAYFGWIRTRENLSRTGRMVYLAAVATVALVCAWPWITSWRAVQWRAHSLPVVGDFESGAQVALWDRGGSPSRLQRLKHDPISGKASLHVIPTEEGRELGAEFHAGGLDWSKWPTFEFRIRNPGPPLVMGVRIRDMHWAGTHADQLNWQCGVPTGETSHALRMEGWKLPGRALDRTAIKDAKFFVKVPAGYPGFVIDEVKLSNAEGQEQSRANSAAISPQP